MIYFGRFCCICLDKGKLEKLLTIQENNSTYHEKLSSLIPQMDVYEIKEVVFICEKCKTFVDDMYNFRNTCLDNNNSLWKHISRLRVDRSSKIIDSTLVNDLYKIQVLEYVCNANDSKYKDFEKINIKTEFRPIDDHVLPVNELNNQQLVINGDVLNVNIKEEIEISDEKFHESNSDGNNTEDIYENTRIKKEEDSSLYTDVECTENEVFNKEIYIRENTSGNNDTHEENVNSISENVIKNINVDKQSEGANNSEDNSFHIEKDPLENKKACNKSISNNHDKTSHSKENYECDACKKTFNSSYARNVHSHACNKSTTCEICNRTFGNKKDYKTHVKTHIGEKLHKCDVCSKTLTSKSNLKRHINTHTGEKSFKCDTCNKSFTSNYDLKRHIETHSDILLYKCAVCGKTFNCRVYLKAHMKVHTGVKPYKCEICNKSFVSSFYLKTHIKIHTGEKSYKCEICDKCFTHPSSLVVHKRYHTGEKPFVCEICGKSFAVSISLITHNRIHTGDKPFKCEICGKSCVNTSELKRHTNIHTGTKPYKCELCNKSFSTNPERRKHIRVHTGEKPYKCQMCNKSFNDNSQLNLHIKMHTGERPYPCNICNKSFITSSYLKKHILLHKNS